MEETDIQEYIKQLEHERLRVELSDDFAYTNGKIKYIDNLLREAKEKLRD
jgi:ERCC4-related helicase